MAFIAIFHLIAFLFKVGLLAAFYSIIPLLIIYFSRSLRARFEGRSGYILATGLYSILFVGLLVYSASFWGNRGFYDTARLPIGSDVSINCSDGAFVYFRNGVGQQEIGSFAVKDDKIFAVDADYACYLIYDCSTSELKQFAKGKEYDEFVLQNNYPSTSEFQEFFDHYNDYWNGWRRWLLP